MKSLQMLIILCKFALSGLMIIVGCIIIAIAVYLIIEEIGYRKWIKKD